MAFAKVGASELTQNGNLKPNWPNSVSISGMVLETFMHVLAWSTWAPNLSSSYLCLTSPGGATEQRLCALPTLNGISNQFHNLTSTVCSCLGPLISLFFFFKVKINIVAKFGELLDMSVFSIARVSNRVMTCSWSLSHLSLGETTLLNGHQHLHMRFYRKVYFHNQSF